MAKNRVNLGFQDNDVLKNHIPLRIHDGIYVAMMSDIIATPERVDGIETGDYRLFFIRPVEFAPIADDPEAPRVSAKVDRAYHGRFDWADVGEDKLRLVLCKEHDENDKTCWLLSKQAVKPWRFSRDGFGLYLPTAAQMKRKKKTIVSCGAFPLFSDAEAFISNTTESSDERSKMGREFQSVDFGVLCQWKLIRTPVGKKVVGRTPFDTMWLVENQDGELVQGNRHDAEALRPVFERNEKLSLHRLPDGVKLSVSAPARMGVTRRDALGEDETLFRPHRIHH